MDKVYKLPIVLEPQPEGGFTITCPVLPELLTEADTMDEVNANVTDALMALIEIYEDLGEPLPDILQPIQSQSKIWAETLVELSPEQIAA